MSTNFAALRLHKLLVEQIRHFIGRPPINIEVDGEEIVSADGAETVVIRDRAPKSIGLNVLEPLGKEAAVPSLFPHLVHGHEQGLERMDEIALHLQTFTIIMA